MKLVIALFLAITLVGCDAWFYRRINIETNDSAAFAVNFSSTETLVEAIRTFPSELGLACHEGKNSLISCYAQPIHISALLAQQGATVCFYATGAPFEKRRFNNLMAQLEDSLVERFGRDSVDASDDWEAWYEECASE